MKRNRVICRQCFKTISERTDGSGIVAHKCPHGEQCIRPAWSKAPAGQCERCSRLRLRDANHEPPSTRDVGIPRVHAVSTEHLATMLALLVVCSRQVKHELAEEIRAFLRGLSPPGTPRDRGPVTAQLSQEPQAHGDDHEDDDDAADRRIHGELLHAPQENADNDQSDHNRDDGHGPVSHVRAVES